MKNLKPRKLYNTKNMSRREWLMARQSGLGGSDVASIAGLNQYSSAWQVFIDKTEPINEVSEETISEPAEWGNRNEPTIRAKFRENHPEWKVQQSHIMWQSAEYPFMLANVDGLVFDPKRGWGILEIKNTSEWLSDNWGEEQAPEHYIIQLQHYLKVLNLKWGIFAVLIGGNRYKEFYVERDEELIEALVEIEKDFWENHVLANVAPDPDGSKSAGDILDGLFPSSTALPEDEILELEDATILLINELDELKVQEKEIKNRKAEIENLLKKKMGEHQVGMVEERKVTWKPSRSFSEKELEKAKPDLYKQFAITTLDKAKFKKAYPKVYEAYMIPSEKRSLTVKEDGFLYAVSS
ncbi:YqaJ viral recombinase family protein [Peribacillus frigoritolerans]|uniref:YqaJ viral recombinase family nuclease n=1 Tax=Peribacillus frigoritolerans TaxID=450367 RepID=UPI00207ABC7E|nr:YqaJ viral recombinase family protein [Peribacillus frigoritolerans]USK77732.1 YqaJ viral recombinase family protein [Peribacillus frigoritolerans]